MNCNQIDLATHSEKNLQYVPEMCQNGQNCYSLNQKKSSKREFKISSLVRQMDRKNTEKKGKLLLKFR